MSRVMPERGVACAALAFALACLHAAAPARPLQAAQAAPSALTPRAFLPSVSLTTTCPTTSSTVVDLVPI